MVLATSHLAERASSLFLPKFVYRRSTAALGKPTGLDSLLGNEIQAVVTVFHRTRHGNVPRHVGTVYARDP